MHIYGRNFKNNKCGGNLNTEGQVSIAVHDPDFNAERMCL